MSFSGVIEPVGIRDLAKDDPEEYRKHIQHFLKQIKYSLTSDLNAIKLYFLNDYLFIETEDLETIILFICNLRTRLIQSKMVVRGAISDGNLEAKEIKANSLKEGASICGYEFGALATELSGMRDGLKGLGIKVAKRLVKKRVQIEDKLKTIIEQKNQKLQINGEDEVFLQQYGKLSLLPQFFYNYHITDSKIRRYDGYYDLQLDEEFLTPSNLDKIMRLFRQSRVSSKKLARFFIPLLINWSKHMNLAPPEKPENLSTETSKTKLDADVMEDSYKDLDGLISSGKLTGFREIIGIELVFLSLMDRIFGTNTDIETYDQEKLNKLRNYYKRIRKWIQNYIRSDNQPVLIPKNILKPSSKRKFVNFIEEV